MTRAKDVLQQRLSDLPKDIGRLMFEHLASIGDTSSPLVSREVQRWVEPIMYNEVVLDAPVQVRRFHRTIVTFTSNPASNKPSDFFEKNVKLLRLFTGDLHRLALTQILHSCSSIRSLAVISTIIHDELDESEEQQMRPWRTSPSHIYVSLGDMHILPFQGALFTNVTHLEMQAQMRGDTEWPRAHFNNDKLEFLGLPLPPSLTHLAFGMYPRAEGPGVPLNDLASRVQEFACLIPATVRVFLLVVSRPGWDRFWGRVGVVSRGEVDERVVVVVHEESVQPPPAGVFNEGEEGMVICQKGFQWERWVQWGRLGAVGEGYWRRAEEIVDERKRKRKGVAAP